VKLSRLYINELKPKLDVSFITKRCIWKNYKWCSFFREKHPLSGSFEMHVHRYFQHPIP
jgi:hypothetical protein